MSAVRYAETFSREFLSELRYALDRGEQGWAAQLAEDLLELEVLLGQFPYAGLQLDHEGVRTLRKLSLRRSPFLVWYTTDARTDEVVLARLFHAKQRAPRPRLR